MPNKILAGKAGLTAEGQWDSAKVYSRLSVVTYNDTMFISKKEPPVGVAPTEGEYWMVAISDYGNGDRTKLLEYMCLNNDFVSPIITDDSEITVITDDSNNAILSNWKYKEV